MRSVSCLMTIVTFLPMGTAVAWSAEDLEAVIATLERQGSAIGAHEIRFVVDDKTVWGTAASAVQVSHFEYRQCFNGTSRRLEGLGLMNVEHPADKFDSVTVLFEGKYRNLDRAAQTGQIGGETDFPPDYICGAYLFTEGLLGWLKGHQADIRCVRELIDGAEHLKCIWQVEGAHVHAWLNPQKWYQLAKLEVFSVYQPAMYPDARKQGTHRVVVSDYWQSDRAALPSKVHTSYEVEFSDGRREIMGDKMLTVSSVTVNKVFPADEFTVHFPNGFVVTDVERQVYYVRGDPKSERRMGQPVDSTPIGAGGVRLGKSGWGGSWLWIVGGFGLIAVAIFLKFRAARE